MPVGNRSCLVIEKTVSTILKMHKKKGKGKEENTLSMQNS